MTTTKLELADQINVPSTYITDNDFCQISKNNDLDNRHRYEYPIALMTSWGGKLEFTIEEARKVADTLIMMANRIEAEKSGKISLTNIKKKYAAAYTVALP